VTTVEARLNIQVTGAAQGRPMVLVHGYGCDLSMWRFVAPAFEDRHRVVAYDQAGFGGSGQAWDPERHTTLDAYADDLVRLLDEMDLTDAVLVGHSVASMIIALAAAQRPERVAQLVMVSPSARYLDDPEQGYVGGFTEADVADLLRSIEANHLSWSAAMAPAIMGNPDRPELGQELTDLFCRVDPEVARVFAAATFLGDNRADLARVGAPTLVLQTRDDVIASEQVGRYVADALPDSTFVLLEAVGHCPNLSAPGETSAVIASFLDAREGSS
jgi:sigma-B regulation protein RsbQ